MDDLFAPSSDFERIRLEGADVQYLRDLALHPSPNLLLKALIEETPWTQESVRVWGKVHPQPRLIAWYGEEEAAYSYSGIQLQPLQWTPTISIIKRQVENRAQTKFNSVLLNFYRDGNDSMGFHSDDEPELGSEPIIASVSLGVERTLIFKSRTDSAAKLIKLRLGSGSLLLMRGNTQRLYKHGIAKERGLTKPRVNLTFRKIYV